MSRESLSGLEVLARNSMSITHKRASQVSLAAEIEADHINSIDDKNWSWNSLRNNFRTHNLGDLYKRYVTRLQNAYFNVYLLLQISISVIYIGSIIVVNKDTLEEAIPEISVHVIITCTCMIIFCIICDEKVFRASKTAQIIASVIITVLITGSDLGLSIFFYIETKKIRTASAFQTLIIIYFFLPLPQKYQSILLGILVSLSHLLVSGFIFYADNEARYQRTFADAIYYICGNCVGLYSQFLSEVTVRRAFLDRRRYIRSTIKKDYEAKQEAQLLQSILPSHISVQVKTELLQVFQELQEAESINKNSNGHKYNNGGIVNHNNNQKNSNVMRKKPFSKLFVEKHNNVSILYADIVNFTPLTVKLSPEDLVETLNQLFGQFDEAANRYNCLRIKLLGDCYYCVSGLNSSSPDHAKNCVLLGLEMIDIIRGVRERLGVDVEMRIGVHSGNILSGLLGIYKWQYDIWSKDVTIANHMEQSGKPGKIHITRQTKEFLDGEYECKQVHVLRDKYLSDNKIETYLISPKKFTGETIPEEAEEEEQALTTITEVRTRGSTVSGIVPKFLKGGRRDSERIISTPSRPGSESSTHRASIHRIRGIKKKSIYDSRPTDVTGEHVHILRNMLNQVDQKMKDAIDEMPLRKMDQWCGSKKLQENVHPVLMNFNNWPYEKEFVTLPDPLFKYYIACSLFILICMGVIQAIVMPSDHMVLWVAFGLGGSYLLILIPFAWVSYIWNRIKDPHRELDTIPDPESRLIRFFYKAAKEISKNWTIRVLIYMTVATVLSTFAIIDVVECDNETAQLRAITQECQNPWYFTYSCTLAILGIYGFFRIHLMIKILLCIFSITAYSWTMFNYRQNVFDQDKGASPAIPPVYAHVIYLVKIILLLHIMDRQMEYINRLDFIWNKKLHEELRAATITKAINEVLIHNILPMKIAKIYMDPTRIGEGYSRSYTDVAVMFASIPNFMDFYTETELNDQGIKCLQLLNEIIVDFDNALFEFEGIEKIKVIGSTYMAACGLEVHETGRLSTSTRYQSVGDLGYQLSIRNRESQETLEPNLLTRRKNLITLVKFAAAMMVRLKGINKDAFQEFHLRIGIDSGPIIAGVIGAQKPNFDIWGDTVNMSSRMDSTGVNGKIQLAEHSARLIMQEGVKCTFRDRIKVKGKEKLIPTYFVNLNEKCEVEFERPYYLNPIYKLTRSRNPSGSSKSATEL